MDTKRIKSIRKRLGLSQEKFAHELGATLATVNRWENGRNKPGQMAVRLLEQMEKKADKQAVTA